MKSKRELAALISYARSKGYKVDFVGEKVLHDYAAINPEFAKLTGWPDQPRHYKVDKNQSIDKQIHSLRHEIIEDGLMRSGEKYADAHLTALKLENVKLSPQELNALSKIGSYSVTHVHDDGDLTIKTKDGDYVVTTEGQTFKGTNKEVNPMPAKSEKQRRFAGAELGRLRRGERRQTTMTEKQLEELAEKNDNPREEALEHEPHMRKRQHPIMTRHERITPPPPSIRSRKPTTIGQHRPRIY